MPVGIYSIEKRKGLFQKGHCVSEETRLKQSESAKGKLVSEETRRKMSEKNKGRIITEAARIKTSNTLKGHIVSEITRKKLSDALVGTRMGSKNTSWKGGILTENLKIRASVEYRLWRESVFARDMWTCQKCKDNKGRNLNAHHIKGFTDYPEFRTSIENGITLCDKCHINFHKIYGSQNNTREQLEEYLWIT